MYPLTLLLLIFVYKYWPSPSYFYHIWPSSLQTTDARSYLCLFWKGGRSGRGEPIRSSLNYWFGLAPPASLCSSAQCVSLSVVSSEPKTGSRNKELRLSDLPSLWWQQLRAYQWAPAQRWQWKVDVQGGGDGFFLAVATAEGLLAYPAQQWQWHSFKWWQQ